MKRRKDPKGNLLKEREGYVEEKNGEIRYRYRYQDKETGKKVCIYAKSLSKLREKVKEYQEELEKDVIKGSEENKIALNEAFERYLKTKHLAGSTKSNYLGIWENLVKNSLGMRSVGEIRQSEIKALYAGLSQKGYSNSMIREIHSMLHPTFEMLYQDEIISKNPAAITRIREYGYVVKEKKALTTMEQEIFLEFVKNSNTYQSYYYMLQIALRTGLRAGELLGLQWSDLDMDNCCLNINHQLIYKNYGDGYKLHIESTKTDSGKRIIPIFDKTYDAFLGYREQYFRNGVHCLAEIDGYKDFVFLTKNGNPIMPNAYNNVLYNIVRAQNKAVCEKKTKETILLPHISSHTLRHTACTRRAETGIDGKVLQYIMGHASSSITTDVYNHIAEYKRVEEEMRRVEKLESLKE